MSSRPQEVVVSEQKQKRMDNLDKNFRRPSFQNSTSDVYVSIDSHHAISDDTSSRKLNLVAEYQSIMTQQELAYKSKMQELKSIKNQVQQTAAQISRVHEIRVSRDQ